MGFVVTDADFMTVAELTTEVGWPLDYTASRGLIPYIKRIRGDAKVIEIGTARGEASYLILEQCPNVTHLYTIDPFLGYKDWVGVIDQDTMTKYKNIAYKNLEVFDSRANIMNLSSAEAVDLFEDSSYNVLFVDGSHDKDMVYRDLELYVPKIVPGGIIAIHDTNIASVNEAIKEFREVKKIRQPVHTISNGVVFWNKF